GGHQAANAKWLADGGAAIVMQETELRGLANKVIDLLNDEPGLARMRAASAAMAKPGAADAIAQLILEVART
ncbi:MAG: glycosyltransferase, partial [Tepidiformaceae bacterium]